MTRSAMLAVLDSEYIKMARSKGVPEAIVIWKHALKNAAIPVVTLISVVFVTEVNGAIVTETIFAWPGVGRLCVEAVLARDYPVVQTIVMIASVMFIVTNLVIDLLYVFLDPRIRHG